MSNLRLGIIGLGAMGTTHARAILDGRVARCHLAAICDHQPALFEKYPGIPAFTDSDELIASGLVDAVFIVTPHYSHTTIGIAALQAGLHLLVEKPISAHKADCLRLIQAHKNPRQVFAAMFNQRTDPRFIKLRELITGGELGEIRRISWIITNWFRTQAYYDSGGWRATWAGEGGGVLLNQCPHQLDLWQWLFGMPDRLHAFCQIGRYHLIEVEDDVTAFLEYENGTTGTFITSTGEAPGTNRLEVTGDRGRVVLEQGILTFVRNQVPMDEFLRTSPERFSAPVVESVEIPVADGNGSQHVGILNNFVEAVLDGAPLIAPAAEGIYSVELANAMLQSSFEHRTIELPLDATDYTDLLSQRITRSRFTKPEIKTPSATEDFSNSFSH